MSAEPPRRLPGDAERMSTLLERMIQRTRAAAVVARAAVPATFRPRAGRPAALGRLSWLRSPRPPRMSPASPPRRPAPRPGAAAADPRAAHGHITGDGPAVSGMAPRPAEDEPPRRCRPAPPLEPPAATARRSDEETGPPRPIPPPGARTPGRYGHIRSPGTARRRPARHRRIPPRSLPGARTGGSRDARGHGIAKPAPAAAGAPAPEPEAAPGRPARGGSRRPLPAAPRAHAPRGPGGTASAAAASRRHRRPRAGCHHFDRPHRGPRRAAGRAAAPPGPRSGPVSRSTTSSTRRRTGGDERLPRRRRRERGPALAADQRAHQRRPQLDPRLHPR